MTDCLETVSLTKLKGPIDEVDEFTHLGSVVSTRGATEQDVEARLEKSEQFSGRWIIRGIKISLEGQVK